MSKFRYRFSIGNSTEGQVGMCFDVTLEQEKEDHDDAVTQTKALLAEYGAEASLTGLDILPQPFDGICVYVNPAAITKEDIVHVAQAE